MNNLKYPIYEEIQGLGKDKGARWGYCSIDTPFIRHDTRTVHDVVRRIDQGSLVMALPSERAFIWDDYRQSKLIESVLIGIPLPAFYLADAYSGRMIVVDGLQRLSTIGRYLKNDLRLNLPKQEELHKKKFDDLSLKFQNRIEDCNLVLYIVDADIPERYRLDIFERVNDGQRTGRKGMK